jgi:hypothetical protein
MPAFSAEPFGSFAGTQLSPGRFCSLSLLRRCTSLWTHSYVTIRHKAIARWQALLKDGGKKCSSSARLSIKGAG